MTGSGKTLCFVLPILNCVDPGLSYTRDVTIEKVDRGKTIKKTKKTEAPQAIIITNGQHLSNQIKEVFKVLLKHVNPIWKDKRKGELVVGKCDKGGHEPGHVLIMVAKSF
jgi:superfamily II DNA/RNA helicase